MAVKGEEVQLEAELNKTNQGHMSPRESSLVCVGPHFCFIIWCQLFRSGLTFTPSPNIRSASGHFFLPPLKGNMVIDLIGLSIRY